MWSHEEVCSVSWFLRLNCVSPFKIYHRFIAVDVDSVVRVQLVGDWCREFRNG